MRQCIFCGFFLIWLVRIYRALSAVHVLRKQRLSGKKIKQLLPEKAIIGIFLSVIKNKFGLADWS